MAVHGQVKLDDTGGLTQGFAVLVIRAVDEDGNALGPTQMIYAHDGSPFTGLNNELQPCCSGGT